ncbi:hypothetical protein JCM8097_008096 [Rhodosporidiobolus ruineniae]
MGQTASAPSTPFLGTPSLRRPKHKKGDSGDSFFLAAPDAPPVPTSAWRPRRRSLVRKSEKQDQRTEAQRFLAEAARDQKEVARTLAEAQLEGRTCTPRLILTDEDDDEMEGLAIRVGGRKLSRDDPVLPPLELHETLEALHEQFKLASLAHSVTSSSMGTPLQRIKSAPSRQSMYLAPPPLPASTATRSPSPSASPVSHWSESSFVPSPAVPFESFRNSLTKAQLNRLSAIFPPEPPSSSLSSPPSSRSAPSSPSPAAHSHRTSHSIKSLLGRRKKRATTSSVRSKGPIVVVEAHRIGSGRYSMLKDAADAATLSRRASEAERKASLATITPTRKASTVSIDVWDSALPLVPGRAPAPVPSPMLALSPRFSTTPAMLSSIYRSAPEDVQADVRKLNRTSWIVLDGAGNKRYSTAIDLSAYIAASPELTCAAEEDEIFVATTEPAPSPALPSAVLPAPTPVASRPPGNHPASYHSRFARLAPPPPPVSFSRRASTSSLLTASRQPQRRRSSLHAPGDEIVIPAAGRPRRRSSYRVSVADIDEENSLTASPVAHLSRRASAVSLATTTNSADQAVVSRAIQIRRRSRLGSLADTAGGMSTPGSEFPLPFGRPSTMYSQHSGLSFPRSVHDESETPLGVSPALPTAFAGYTLGDAAPASRASVADSIAPETVDAFPMPPPLSTLQKRVSPPAPLNLSSHLHRSLVGSGSASSPSPTTANHSSTPSTASFTTSSSNSSVELLADEVAAENVLNVDFTAAAILSSGTFSKEAIEASPALSSGSLATFALEDILNDLTAGGWDGAEPIYLPVVATELPPVAPLRPKGRLSLEQPDFLPSHLAAPPLPLSLPPRSHSPPRFLSTFSFNPAPGLAAKVAAEATSPATHPLHDGIFASPFLNPGTPDAGAIPSASYRFPPSPSPVPLVIEGEGGATWTALPTWTRASAGDALHPASSYGYEGLESRRGTFPEWVPPSQRERAKERSLFDALLARSQLEGEQEKVREQRLGSVDKRGFNKREISDWIVKARRESEVEEV